MHTSMSKFQVTDGALKVCMRIAALLAVLSFAPAYADIYMWQDADGAKRMSNQAPRWYNASAPSRVRTQVLVNGHLVDDTGIAQPDREKLQATRSKAEAWGRPRPPPPAPVAAAQPPSQQGQEGAKPADTAASAGIPAQILGGIKSVFDARQSAGLLVDEMSRQSRPR